MNEVTELPKTDNPRNASWARNPLLALCEFAVIAVVFCADVHHHI